MSNLISVHSVIKLNLPMIRKLTEAQTTALEQTAEALHTEVVQAQVFPRDTGALQGERTAIKAGDTITKEYPSGESASNTITKASNGKVSLITTAPTSSAFWFLFTITTPCSTTLEICGATLGTSTLGCSTSTL